ncbi:MAG: hypothetical protein WDM84_06670 [Bauldia sp.]
MAGKDAHLGGRRGRGLRLRAVARSGRDADPSQDVSDAVQALLESLPPLNPQDPRFWG